MAPEVVDPVSGCARAPAVNPANGLRDQAVCIFMDDVQCTQRFCGGNEQAPTTKSWGGLFFEPVLFATTGTSLRDGEVSHQRGEPRLGSERREPRLPEREDQQARSLLVGSLEPVERLLLVAQSGVDEGDKIGRAHV